MRKCFYCRNDANSREHVRADWLKPFVSSNSLNHMEYFEAVTLYGSRSTTKHRSGDPMSRRVKYVCTACNNGWMGTLQERAKPLVLSMFANTPLALTSEQQRVLSAWISMSAIAADKTNLETSVVRRADGAALRSSQASPLHWRIFVGLALAPVAGSQFEQLALAISTDADAIEADAKKEGPLNAKFSTFTVGVLVCHCIVMPPKLLPVSTDLAYLSDFSDELSELMPHGTCSISWPPKRLLEQERIDLLANCVFDDLRRRKGL